MAVIKKTKRKLETTAGFYRKYIKASYENAHKAKRENKSVAWVASTFPVEVLLAMDVIPVWPENYASVCAARQVSVRLCETAERKGFSKDLCSYARCVLGSIFEKEDLPEGGLPEPDFLVTSTCACDTHLKWFQVVSKLLNKPLFLLDVPYNVEGFNAENLRSYHVKHYVSQLEELISFLEKQTGTRLDENKLRETMMLSNLTSNLWMEIQNYRKAIPAPMGARDAFSAVYFMLCVPGTPLAVEFYKRLRDEVKERVEKGIGVIEDERCRLVWDNLPMWFNLKFFDYLNDLGAVVVAETFSHVWAGNLNPAKPLESLARKYLPNFANCGIQRKIDLIVNLVRDFSVDGVILAMNWGCRMMSIGETLVKDAVYERLKVSSLILDIDSSDWRNYNEARVKAMVETFVRTISRKERG